MLRHIVSLSLAMTACVTLIPTKVYAATFTFTILPVGSLQRNPGDTIEFNVIIDQSALNIKQSVLIKEVIFPPREFIFSSAFDDTELSFNPLLSKSVSNYTATTTATIASLFFTVLPGVVKDGKTDLARVDVSYSFTDPQIGFVSGTTFVSNRETILDVEPKPVPEPVTIFGTAIALGCGALFKRKSYKKTVS